MSRGQFGRGIGVGEEEGQRICRDEGIERVGGFRVERRWREQEGERAEWGGGAFEPRENSGVRGKRGA